MRSKSLSSRASGLLAYGAGSALAVLCLCPSPPAEAGTPPAQVGAPGASGERTDYVIGPGDTLQLFVWKEPDLTREVAVRLDGKITVPLLGDVEASGRTPEQLGGEIGSKLRRFFEAPQVTVGIAHAGGSRFYVLGQVTKSGAFSLTGRTTLVQALAQAEGFKEFAKLDRIVVIREDRGEQTFLTVNYKKLEAASDISQNIALRPGDTIVVP